MYVLPVPSPNLHALSFLLVRNSETPSKDGETNGLRSHIDGDEWLPMASTPSWWQLGKLHRNFF